MTIAVKLRNLSAEGALIEGESLPAEGSSLVFQKKELSVPGRVAWVADGRAGIAFDTKLDPSAVLRHVPQSKPQPKLDFRRPGIRANALSAGERKMAKDWIWGDPLVNRGD